MWDGGISERGYLAFGNLSRKLSGGTSSLTCQDGELTESYKKPTPVSVWLGRKDSNLRMADPKSAALPLGHAPPAATETMPYYAR
jgi:hypothetical protein